MIFCEEKFLNSAGVPELVEVVRGFAQNHFFEKPCKAPSHAREYLREDALRLASDMFILTNEWINNDQQMLRTFKIYDLH